jgi:hypothetical protein
VFIGQSFARCDVYLLLLVRWVDIKINIKRKMEREEKH